MSDDLVKRLEATLGSISVPPVMNGDNLSIILCTVFEDDGDPDESGWNEAAITGCDQTLDAIRLHYKPLADRIEALEAALAAKDAEVARLRDELRKAANRIEWCAGIISIDQARMRGQEFADQTRAALNEKAPAGEGEGQS